MSGIRIGTGITPGKTVMTNVMTAYAATSPHRIGMSLFTSHSLQFFPFGLAHEEPDERDRKQRRCVEPVSESESEMLKRRELVDTAKFASHCAAAATEMAMALMRFGNISPSSTQKLEVRYRTRMRALRA